MRDGVDITAEQADQVIAYLTEAVSYFSSTGASSLDALSTQQKQHLLEVLRNFDLLLSQDMLRPMQKLILKNQ